MSNGHVNVALDSEHAEKLARLAERASASQDSLASSLLSGALDHHALPADDQRGGESQAKADISAVFSLGDSGGSNVTAHKDEYVGEAVQGEHRHAARPA